MKRILTISTLILIFAIGFSACGKIEKGTPPAIKKMIRERKGHIEDVIEFEYENSLYYLICDLASTADGMCTLFDEHGNSICYSGGISGRNNCEDFFSKAIEKRVVWTNKKKKP